MLRSCRQRNSNSSTCNHRLKSSDGILVFSGKHPGHSNQFRQHHLNIRPFSKSNSHSPTHLPFPHTNLPAGPYPHQHHAQQPSRSSHASPQTKCTSSNLHRLILLPHIRPAPTHSNKPSAQPNSPQLLLRSTSTTGFHRPNPNPLQRPRRLPAKPAAATKSPLLLTQGIMKAASTATARASGKLRVLTTLNRHLAVGELRMPVRRSRRARGLCAKGPAVATITTEEISGGATRSPVVKARAMDAVRAKLRAVRRMRRGRLKVAMLNPSTSSLSLHLTFGRCVDQGTSDDLQHLRGLFMFPFVHKLEASALPFILSVLFALGREFKIPLVPMFSAFAAFTFDHFISRSPGSEKIGTTSRLTCALRKEAMGDRCTSTLVSLAVAKEEMR